jgi:hypothetical protein
MASADTRSGQLVNVVGVGCGWGGKWGRLWRKAITGRIAGDGKRFLREPRGWDKGCRRAATAGVETFARVSSVSVNPRSLEVVRIFLFSNFVSCLICCSSGISSALKATDIKHSSKYFSYLVFKIS